MSDGRRNANAEPPHALRQGRAVTTPSLDAVFDLLSDRRRRFMLYCLVDASDGFAELEALVDRVAVMEADVDDEPLTDALRKRVAIDLRHRHLPKVAEVDIVDYDDRSGMVRYWGQPTLEEYLEHTAYKEFERD